MLIPAVAFFHIICIVDVDKIVLQTNENIPQNLVGHGKSESPSFLHHAVEELFAQSFCFLVRRIDVSFSVSNLLYQKFNLQIPIDEKIQIAVKLIRIRLQPVTDVLIIMIVNID